MPRPFNPHGGKTINRRAGCGRPARPVRREGRPNSIGLPYPYHGYLGTRKGNAMRRSNARRGGLMVLAMAVVAAVPVGIGANRLFAQQPRVLSGDAAQVESVAFSPDGSTLAAGDFEGTVLLWDLKTGKTRAKMVPYESLPWAKSRTALDLDKGPITRLVFAPGGRSLAALFGSCQQQLAMYDAATGTSQGSIVVDDPYWPVSQGSALPGLSPVYRHPRSCRCRGGHGRGDGADAAPCLCAVFSPDGKAVLTGSASSPFTWPIGIWDLDGRLRGWLPGFDHGVAGFAFLPAARGSEQRTGQRTGQWAGGSILLTAGYDRILRIWDSTGTNLGTWDLTRHFPPVLSTRRGKSPQEIQSVVASADGKTVALSGDGGTVCLWDVEKCVVRRTLAKGGGPSMAFSPDGKTLVLGGRVQLWNINEDKPMDNVFGPQGEVAGSVAFSPDGKTLALGGGSAHRDKLKQDDPAVERERLDVETGGRSPRRTSAPGPAPAGSSPSRPSSSKWPTSKSRSKTATGRRSARR